MRLKITMRQLEILLREQKESVIEYLAGTTYLYNPESDAGHSRSINIDKGKFRETGMKASYPKDFQILQNFISDDD